MQFHIFRGAPPGSQLRLTVVGDRSLFTVSGRAISLSGSREVGADELASGWTLPLERDDRCVVELLIHFLAATTVEVAAEISVSARDEVVQSWRGRPVSGTAGETERVSLVVEPAQSAAALAEGPVRRTVRKARRAVRRAVRAALSSPPPALGPPDRSEEPAAELREAARVERRRYANAALLDADRQRTLEPGEPITPERVLTLRLDVGELSAESQVSDPEPLPAISGSAWLDVMVSSTHFAVASGSDPEDAEVAHGRLFLPASGEPARTEDGEMYLWFRLRAPAESGLARARVGYYYRNALLQSQLLEASIGGFLPDEPERSFRIRVDYTATESFTGLEQIPERPRTTVLTNDDGRGVHQFVVRQAGADGERVASPKAFEVDDRTLGALVGDLRDALHRIAPTTRRRRRAQLVQDLKLLAPLGADLYSATAAQFGAIIDQPFRDPENLVIQICRPETSKFTFPWSFLYEIPLYSGDKIELCPLVDRWDDERPLIPPHVRSCPAAEGGQHRKNVYCPFGFWGYRYAVEQLSSTAEPLFGIEVPGELRMVAGVTRYGVRPAEVRAHLERLATKLGQSFPGARIEHGEDRATIQGLLADSMPLLYFYCHGERPRPRHPDTYLGVGNRESITAGDFNNWVKDWRQWEGKEVWGRGKLRPLVFINACHSAEINPDTLVSYLDAFVTNAHAAGLIGTEVKVNQDLAMDLAEEFFRLLAREGGTVEGALRGVRLDFLAGGNLLGLSYTPYCWADLALARAS